MVDKKTDRVKKSLTIRRVSEMTAKPVEWLWPGFLPAGMLAVLDGDPGTGKSVLTCDLTARVSTGRVMPTGGYQSEPGAVLLLNAEDDPERVIKPRLARVEANQQRVLMPEYGERGLCFPRDVSALEDTIREHRVRLCVIDPLAAFVDSSVDLFRDQDVRRLLSRFRLLAENTRCAVLIVRHLNKLGTGKAVYRGGGSIGIIGAARVGLVAAKDPNDPARVILAVSKSNVGPIPKSVAYSIETIGGQAAVGWMGEVEVKADDMLKEQRPDGVLVKCVEFIRGLLANGPIPGNDFDKAIKERGFKPATVGRAKNQLGVKIDHSTGKRMAVMKGTDPDPAPEVEEIDL